MPIGDNPSIWIFDYFQVQKMKKDSRLVSWKLYLFLNYILKVKYFKYIDDF